MLVFGSDCRNKHEIGIACRLSFLRAHSSRVGASSSKRGRLLFLARFPGGIRGHGGASPSLDDWFHDSQHGMTANIFER